MTSCETMVEKAVSRLCNAVSLRRGSLTASVLSQRPASAGADASESDRVEGFARLAFRIDALSQGCCEVECRIPSASGGPHADDVHRIPFSPCVNERLVLDEGNALDLAKFESAEEMMGEEPGIIPLRITLRPSSREFLQEPPEALVDYLEICAKFAKDDSGHLDVRVTKQTMSIGGRLFELEELYGESEQQSQSGDQNSQNHSKECVICLEADRETVLLPCRHFCLCYSCAHEVHQRKKTCPICRMGVAKMIKISQQDNVLIRISPEEASSSSLAL